MRAVRLMSGGATPCVALSVHLRRPQEYVQPRPSGQGAYAADDDAEISGYDSDSRMKAINLGAENDVTDEMAERGRGAARIVCWDSASKSVRILVDSGFFGQLREELLRRIRVRNPEWTQKNGLSTQQRGVRILDSSGFRFLSCGSLRHPAADS